MKIIDPHVDIASIYDEFKIPFEDFFGKRKDIPVSLDLLKENQTHIIGFSLFMDPSLVKTTMFDGVIKYYEFYKRLIENTSALHQIKVNKDLETLPDHKIGYYYSLEGVECLRNESDLNIFYDIGVRMIGLTWEPANLYATGIGAKSDFGLTKKGEMLLKEINKYKLLIDSAHLSPKSFIKVDKIFTGTIINTHANAKAITDSPHNLSDDQIQIIIDHKGIVCLIPTKQEIGGNGTFDDWYRHLDYIASKWGADKVGLCSDIFPLPEYPFVNNAKDVTLLKNFQKYLLTKMDKQLVQKICYDNVFNVLKKNL